MAQLDAATMMVCATGRFQQSRLVRTRRTANPTVEGRSTLPLHNSSTKTIILTQCDGHVWRHSEQYRRGKFQVTPRDDVVRLRNLGVACLGNARATTSSMVMTGRGAAAAYHRLWVLQASL